MSALGQMRLVSTPEEVGTVQLRFGRLGPPRQIVGKSGEHLLQCCPKRTDRFAVSIKCRAHRTHGECAGNDDHTNRPG